MKKGPEAPRGGEDDAQYTQPIHGHLLSLYWIPSAAGDSQSHTSRHGKLWKIASEFAYKNQRNFKVLPQDNGYRSVCLGQARVAPRTVFPGNGRATWPD